MAADPITGLLGEIERLKAANAGLRSRAKTSKAEIRRLGIEEGKNLSRVQRLEALAVASLAHAQVCEDPDPPTVLCENLKAALAAPAREGDADA